MTSNRLQATSRVVSVAGYKKLRVWETADTLAHAVYDLTLIFPSEELFGLTSQLRRAVLSIPANIIEGHARKSRNEFRHFLSIALGSLAEVEYYLEFALKRKYTTLEQFEKVNEYRIQCGQLLWKFYQSIE